MSDTNRSRSGSPNSSLDTLFDEPVENHVATRTTPPIPGLWIFPALFPSDSACDILDDIAETDHFRGGVRDQVMFFTRPPPHHSTLPTYLTKLSQTLENLLRPVLPTTTITLLFSQPLARQVILNLYLPGEGIGSHIDLPNRYEDGIVGVSLTGACVMTFTRAAEGPEEQYHVYLPSHTVYVLTGPARWEWSHGIAAQDEDVVQSDDGHKETLVRALRVSVTMRWMRDGGDLLV